MELTYEQLFDILRREKSRDDLQKLDTKFYDQVRAFLSIKQDLMRQEAANGMESLAAQRASIEYQNVKKILKELYDRRERKVITMAMHRTRTDSGVLLDDALLPEEKVLLEQLVHLMLQTREQTLSFAEARMPLMVTPSPTSYDQDMEEDTTVEVENGDTMSTPEELLSVRFIAPVPKFVGKDLRVFGPYETGMQAELPYDVAQILIRKGRAQESD